MSFYKKYELQRLIHEFDAKVFRAVQNSTGAQVLLHVFPATDSAREVVSEAQRRIAGGGAIELIETGEFAGSMYVVTVPIDGIENLRAYLSRSQSQQFAPPSPVQASTPPPVQTFPSPPVQSSPPVQASPPAPAPLPLDEPLTPLRRRTTQVIAHGPVTVNTDAPMDGPAPGEFTMLFGGGAGARAASSPPVPPAPAPHQTPPAAEPAAMGEFTRMFSGAMAAAPPAAPPPPVHSTPPAAPPPPPRAQAEAPPPYQAPPAAQAPPRSAPRDREMDEFEAIFGPPGGRPFPQDEPKPAAQRENPLPAWPQAAPPPAAPASNPAQEADFSMFFGSSFHGAEVDIEAEHKRAAREEPAARRPFQQASEFTRMFGTDDPAKHQPVAPLRPTDQTQTSAMFGTPQELQQAAASLTGAPDAQAGPSEYTRMIGGAPGPGAPGAGLNNDSATLKSGALSAVSPGGQQAPGQQPGPVPKSSNIGIYIAVAGIVLSLLVAIVLLIKSS